MTSFGNKNTNNELEVYKNNLSVNNSTSRGLKSNRLISGHQKWGPRLTAYPGILIVAISIKKD